MARFERSMRTAVGSFVLGMGLVGGAGLAYGDVVIGDWENQTDGWIDWGNPPAIC